MAFTNKNRIKTKGNKKVLSSTKIAEFKNSANFCVPLKVGNGAESKLLVSVGDVVKVGTVLGAPSGNTSSFIYSPCGGAVTAVETRINSLGERCTSVSIEPSYKNVSLFFAPLEAKTSVSLFGRLVESGCVETWGKRLPSYNKYISKNQKSSRTVIVKLLDTEPYTLSNDYISHNYFKEVAIGASYFFKVAEAGTLVFVGDKRCETDKIFENIETELQKTDVVSAKVKFALIKPNYPQDEEHLLVKNLFGKEIPVSKDVSDEGYFIESAQTCLNFYRAVDENRPTYSAFVTVAGDNIKIPSVCEIKNGTQMADIFATFGIADVEKFSGFAIGGALGGVAQCDQTIGFPYSVNSFCSFKSNYKEMCEVDCINCGRCIKACPVKLSPMMLDQFIILKEFGKAKKYGVDACINCGLCSYACPAKRNLAQRINDCQKAIKEGRTM